MAKPYGIREVVAWRWARPSVSGCHQKIIEETPSAAVEAFVHLDSGDKLADGQGEPLWCGVIPRQRHWANI